MTTHQHKTLKYFS